MTTDQFNGAATAFPSGDCDTAGLTKRELLAAMAMQGMVSRVSAQPEKIAEAAVNYADALLKRLGAEEPTPEVAHGSGD